MTDHIEEAARLLDPKAFVDPKAQQALFEPRRDIARRKAALVYTLARAATLEEAAKVAEEWTMAKHIAFDMKVENFPKKTLTHNAIAAAIRQLAEEK